MGALVGGIYATGKLEVYAEWVLALERIQVLRRTQSFPVPAITLQDPALTPFNHLNGSSGLDSHLIQIDYYGTDYTVLKNIALVCRQTLEAPPAVLSMQSEIDGYEPDKDPELFHLTQTWLVFTT